MEIRARQVIYLHQPQPSFSVEQHTRVMVEFVSGREVPEDVMRTMLSSRELAILHSLVPSKHHAWLLGRCAAKRAVARYYAIRHQSALSYRVIEVLSHDDGSPRIVVASEGEDGAHPLRLSISHSHDAAVAVIIDGARYAGVGIDIEHIRIFKPHILRSYTTVRERAFLEQCRDSVSSTFLTTLLWCSKEAYTKAIRTGLRTHPRSIECQVDLKDQVVRLSHNGMRAHAEWTIKNGTYIIVTVTL